jgi:hypothetical protein
VNVGGDLKEIQAVARGDSHAQVTSTLPLALAASLSKAAGDTSRSVAWQPTPVVTISRCFLAPSFNGNTHIDRRPSDQHFFFLQPVHRTSML